MVDESLDLQTNPVEIVPVGHGRWFLGITAALLRTLQGRRAMHMAAIHGHVEVLSALVAAGAVVTKATKHDRWGPGSCADSVATRDSRGQTPLHFAAAEGHAAAVARLLELGAAVAPKDNIDGGGALQGRQGRCNTPLHWAAEEGHVEVAKLLLAARAPLDSQNNDGWGPRWEDGLYPLSGCGGDIRESQNTIELNKI
eukprot:Skav225245  [mRNA]  locus=scaffold988:1857:2612:- [translate_table: standard]